MTVDAAITQHTVIGSVLHAGRLVAAMGTVLDGPSFALATVIA